MLIGFFLCEILHKWHLSNEDTFLCHTFHPLKRGHLSNEDTFLVSLLERLYCMPVCVCSEKKNLFLCCCAGADITDYFNYGFTEETWRLYCEKQRKNKNEVVQLNKIAVSPPASGKNALLPSTLSCSSQWYCRCRTIGSSPSYFSSCSGMRMECSSISTASSGAGLCWFVCVFVYMLLSCCLCQCSNGFNTFKYKRVPFIMNPT